MLPMNTLNIVFFLQSRTDFESWGESLFLCRSFSFFFLLFVIIKPPLTQLFFVGYVCWFGSVHKLTIRLVDNNKL